jgi:drug/metabolite transporter (DMT)-like permease
VTAPRDSERRRALALLFTVQCAFATLAVVGKVTLAVVPWPALLLLRCAGAAAVFAVWGFFRGEALLPPQGARARVALLGLLGVFLNQACFLAGLRRTTAIHGAVLVATIPLFTLVSAVVLGRERLRPGVALGLLGGLLGALLVVHPERATVHRELLLGDLLVVVNSAAYGLYLTLARSTVLRVGAAAMVRQVFLVGALLALPLGGPALVAGAGDWGPRAWAFLAYTVLVPTVFAYAANAWCLERLPASSVSAFVYFQPVLAALLAVTSSARLSRWLGVSLPAERLDAQTALGAALVLSGVWAATRPAGRSFEHEPSPRNE